MRIETYRELQSKNELLPLFQHAFWWPFHPKEFEKTIRADPRLTNSPIGYAAIKNNHLVGFVGVMDVATRTIQGSEEKVGGIWGVVTHPAHARKGISTALMRKSHEYFKEKGYKFSLLNTSKSLIAYGLYQKLGYRDALDYISAYKVIKRTRKSPKMIGKKDKLDWNKVLETFNQATQEKTGFVVRGKQYPKMLEKRKVIESRKSIATHEGYVLLKESEGNMFVKEALALTKEEISRLISQVEGKATKTVIAEAILDVHLQKAYSSQGFMTLEGSYEVLMSKPLTEMSFTAAYGHEFYAAATDYF